MDNANIDIEVVTLDPKEEVPETQEEPEPAKVEQAADTEPKVDPAAEAFAWPEVESALVRRAVQQLAAERGDIVSRTMARHWAGWQSGVRPFRVVLA